jgi:hypothetical protein
MNYRVATAFYRTIKTYQFLVDDILSLKKFYTVEIYSSGKYGNVVTGTRLFLTRKSAREFYDRLIECECSARMVTYSRLGGVCYGEV